MERTRLECAYCQEKALHIHLPVVARRKVHDYLAAHGIVQLMLL